MFSITLCRMMWCCDNKILKKCNTGSDSVCGVLAAAVGPN